MPERQSAPSECANCGAAIPPSARACPECGADDRTGWRESSLYDGLDLPDSAFEDDSSSCSDQPRRATPRRINGVAWYWWLAGLLMLFATAVVLIGGR